jgi:hypothetical protein
LDLDCELGLSIQAELHSSVQSGCTRSLSPRPVLQLVLIEKGRQKHENNQINKNLKTPPVKVRTHRRLPEGGE